MSSMKPNFEEETIERWTLGQRFIGTRPLTAEEIAGLRSDALKHLRLSLIPPLVYLGVWCVCIGSVIVFARLASEIWFGLAGFVLVCLGLPVTIALTRDSIRVSRDAHRDAVGGSAECFSPPEQPWGDSESSAETVVLCAASHRVLHGPPDRIGHVARVTQIAAGASEGWRIPTTLPNGLPAERRRLTAAECDELNLAIRKWRTVGFGSALAVAVLLIIPVLFLERPSGPVDFGDLFSSVMMCVICVLVIWKNWDKVSASFALKRDLDEGIALMVRLPEDPSSSAEFLPHSHVLWNLNGAPAGWRNLEEFRR
jgi:hypothetical protein